MVLYNGIQEFVDTRASPADTVPMPPPSHNAAAAPTFEQPQQPQLQHSSLPHERNPFIPSIQNDPIYKDADVFFMIPQNEVSTAAQSARELFLRTRTYPQIPVSNHIWTNELREGQENAVLVGESQVLGTEQQEPAGLEPAAAAGAGLPARRSKLQRKVQDLKFKVRNKMKTGMPARVLQYIPAERIVRVDAQYIYFLDESGEMKRVEVPHDWARQFKWKPLLQSGALIGLNTALWLLILGGAAVLLVALV